MLVFHWERAQRMFSYKQLVITLLFAWMRICASGKQKTVKLLHSQQ